MQIKRVWVGLGFEHAIIELAAKQLELILRLLTLFRSAARMEEDIDTNNTIQFNLIQPATVEHIIFIYLQLD